MTEEEIGWHINFSQIRGVNDEIRDVEVVLSFLWLTCECVEGKDEKLYRKDVYGNEILFHSYNKKGDKSYTIDLIIPLSMGGSYNIENLQLLQVKTKKQVEDDLDKKSRYSLSLREILADERNFKIEKTPILKDKEKLFNYKFRNLSDYE